MVDFSCIYQSGEGRKVRSGTGALHDTNEQAEVKYYLGGCDLYNDINEKQRVVVRARCAAAKLLG